MSDWHPSHNYKQIKVPKTIDIFKDRGNKMSQGVCMLDSYNWNLKLSNKKYDEIYKLLLR